VFGSDVAIGHLELAHAELVRAARARPCEGLRVLVGDEMVDWIVWHGK
jgi:hypothetical protein